MTDVIPTRTAARVPSRRAVTRGVLWAAPTTVVTTAAPAVAASLRKDPGINGWVQNSARRTSWLSRSYSLTVDSTVTNVQTPDRAPFGLYLYDANLQDDYTDATITYWINGTQNRGISWQARSGHSNAWMGPVQGATQVKPDGIEYTPYTWTYNSTIDPAATSTQSDGVERVWLGHFHVRATFTQTGGSSSHDITYWTQRAITVHPGGEGSGSQPQVLTFERRNGTLGPYTPASARSAQVDSTTETPDGAPHEAVS